MRKFYFLNFLLFCLLTRSQVITNTWLETFESTPAYNAPTGGYLSVGGFSVFPSPHGLTTYTGTQSLTKELYTNVGINNEDSIIFPKMTYMDSPNHMFQINYRICDWLGGVPISATVLGPGDTCSIYMNKYLGNAVASRKLMVKINSSNHFQFNTSYASRLFSGPMGAYGFISISDTIALVIKVKRGSTGDYWYDFDDFYMGYTMNINQNNNFSSAEIYPNPTKKNISVRLNSNETLSSISVKNSLGQEVLFEKYDDQSPQNNLDLNSLGQGVYFIEISDKKGQRTTKKFIKE